MVGARRSRARFQKQREHAGVGAGGVLPRPVHVEIPQAHGLQAIHAGEDIAIVFAHQFLQRVRRLRLRRHGFDLGKHQRVPVRRRGSRVNHSARLPLVRGAQHVVSAVDIHFMRGHRLVDGARHGRNGRLMNASTTFAVSAGQVWNVTGWYRANAAESAGTYLEADFGTGLISLRASRLVIQKILSTTTETTSWQQGSGNVTVPSGDTYMRISVYSELSPVATNVYWDNITVTPVLIQTVNTAATTTVLTSSANPSVTGQSVTFTATVSATSPGSGIPTGTVNFQVGGITITGCGAQTLSSGIATCSDSALTVGSSPYSITATYSGDSNYFNSVSGSGLFTNPNFEQGTNGGAVPGWTGAWETAGTGWPTPYTTTLKPRAVVKRWRLAYPQHGGRE